MLNNLVNSFVPALSLTSIKRKAGRDFSGIVISLFCLSFCNTGSVVMANPDEAPAPEVKSIKDGSQAMAAIFRRRFLLDTESKRLARAISVFDVAVPAKTVREVLSDFPKFPEFMKRIKTVEVVRREGNMTFTQSYLKPQFLVNQPLNHTITDVYSKPNTIEWVLVDGNFPSASGRWEIEPLTPHTCRVRYTVAVEPGPFIPPHLVSFALKLVQKEIVSGVKTRVEDFKNRDTATGLGAPIPPPQHQKLEHPLQAHAGTDPV